MINLVWLYLDETKVINCMDGSENLTYLFDWRCSFVSCHSVKHKFVQITKSSPGWSPEWDSDEFILQWVTEQNDRANKGINNQGIKESDNQSVNNQINLFVSRWMNVHCARRCGETVACVGIRLRPVLTMWALAQIASGNRTYVSITRQYSPVFIFYDVAETGQLHYNTSSIH